MSELHSAPRGRSSTRGDRGGQNFRARRSTNGDHKSVAAVQASAEDGELANMKRQYATQLALVRETFPDWAVLDLLLVLHDNDGDVSQASNKILEGKVLKFSEVKKNDQSRSKVKDSPPVGSDANTRSASTRGKGRLEGARGSRGRGAERGRGGFRGDRGGAHVADGLRPGTNVSVPTTESSAWDTAFARPHVSSAWDASTPEGSGEAATDGQSVEAKPTSTIEAAKQSAVPHDAPKKTWAQIFAKPALAPTPQKLAPAALHSEPAAPVPSVTPEPDKESAAVPPDGLPIPSTTDGMSVLESAAVPTEPPMLSEVSQLPSAQLTPSKDELTKENLENLPDMAEPAPTGTAASTVASGSGAGVATPLIGPQRIQPARVTVGGFATTAQKATAPQGRSTSFQRRVFNQQEAVVMPGNHAVDRTAVQFGSLGLNGDAALDVDEDREEAETRTQPPQHSPTQQPRTSLPPVPRPPAVSSEMHAQETLPASKPAPGLPPVNQQPQHQQQSPAIGSQTVQPYGQLGRYSQANAQAEPPVGQSQKAYDPFGVPAPQPSQLDDFPSHTQPQNTTQPPAPSSLGGLSSVANDYPSHYASDQQRNAYQNYYGSGYAQQNSGIQHQEPNAHEHRGGSGLSAAASDAAFPASQSQQTQSRYADAQNSGHNTPVSAISGQPHSAAQSQQIHQPHGQASHSGFPYSQHPYYNTPYFNAYMNHYGGAYGSQGYGVPFTKGMYPQPNHNFNVSPQTTYDTHSSSPANAGAFGAGSMHGRESGLAGALGEYRVSSSQPAHSHQQPHAVSSGPFGGMPDAFGRSQGAFPGHGHGQQAYGQQGPAVHAGADDGLKPFGDKTGPGLSPSSMGQPGRPGSVTNPAGQGAQSGLPPPQSHQQGFGGYPGSQYGLGGLGGHQGSQGHSGGYGGYGAGFGSYGSYGRGSGWGGNYGH